jgi:hypothetical protein
MNKTRSSLTERFAIPPAQDLLPTDSLADLARGKVQDYDPVDELAGAAFLITVALAGFVCLSALIWVIARG